MKVTNGLVGLALLAASGLASATSVTIDFTGKVTMIDAGIGSTVTNGQSITGSFTYDPTIAAAAGGDASGAQFDALKGITFHLGSLTETGTGPSVIFTGHNTQDTFSVFADSSLYPTTKFTGTALNGLVADSFVLTDVAALGVLFSDARHLPNALTGVSSPQSFIQLGFENSQTEAVYYITASLDSLRGDHNQVPEPASLGLLAAGLGAVALRRRRRTEGTRS